MISPGPGTPDEAGISLALVAACAEARMPLLGVCLGHQAIGEAFRRAGGSRAAGHARQDLRHAHDGGGVFEGLPSPFAAPATIRSSSRRRAFPAAWSSMPKRRTGRCRASATKPADPRRAVPSGEHRQRARPPIAGNFLRVGEGLFRTPLDSPRNVPYTFLIRSKGGTTMLTRKQNELLLYIHAQLCRERAFRLRSRR